MDKLRYATTLRYIIPTTGNGWFRIHGWGMSYTKHKPLFSEREGFRTPFMHIGKWRFFFLRPGQG